MSPSELALVAVRKYVEDAEIFLANYSDGLTDLDLNAMIRQFRAGDKVASFMAVPLRRASTSWTSMLTGTSGRSTRSAIRTCS